MKSFHNLTTLLSAVSDETGIRKGNGVTWRISGDILELSTTITYQREPELYRLSVIRAGRLLQAMDYFSVVNGKSLMIQSFPNIEETRLIAVARLPEDRPVKRESFHSFLVEDTSIVKILKSAAAHHGLFFNPATVGAGLVNDLRQLAMDVPEGMALSDFFSLCSPTDNPFIWLKTGQWIELVKQTSLLNSHIGRPAICETVPLESRTRLSLCFEDCTFTQALVLLPEGVLKISTCPSPGQPG